MPKKICQMCGEKMILQSSDNPNICLPCERLSELIADDMERFSKFSDPASIDPAKKEEILSINE